MACRHPRQAIFSFKTMKYTLETKKLLSDLYTPVSCFLKLRQKYPQLLLLESSDYSSKENSKSFICLDPLEGIYLEQKVYHQYDAIQKTHQEINPAQLIDLQKQFLENCLLSKIMFLSSEIAPFAP